MAERNAGAPVAAEPGYSPYPGGEGEPGYWWAFNVWAVLFLGVICVGFLNYLSTYAKSFGWNP